MYMTVPAVCVHNCIHACCPWKPEENIRTPDTGVKENCDQPAIGAGKSRPSARAASLPNLWSHFPCSPKLMFVKYNASK